MQLNPAWRADPTVFQVNRLPAHSSHLCTGLWGESFLLCLDGSWKFFYAMGEDQIPAGFEQPGFDVSQWDDIQVPGQMCIRDRPGAASGGGHGRLHRPVAGEQCGLAAGPGGPGLAAAGMLPPGRAYAVTSGSPLAPSSAKREVSR